MDMPSGCIAFAGASWVVTGRAVPVYYGMHSSIEYGAVAAWGAVPLAAGDVQAVPALRSCSDSATGASCTDELDVVSGAEVLQVSAEKTVVEDVGSGNAMVEDLGRGEVDYGSLDYHD